jgi:chromosome segregation ATPase
MTGNENEMEPQRLERVETSVNHLVSRVTSVEQKITSLDARVTSLDEKVTSLDGKVTSLDGKVTLLDRKVTSLDRKVTLLDGKVTSLDGKVTSLEQRLEVQGRRFDVQMESLRQDIKTFAGNLWGRLDAISAQITDNQKTTGARFADDEEVLRDHGRRIAALERPRRRT